MPAHVMELPRRVIVGSDIIGDTGRMLEDLELGSRVLVLFGPIVEKVAGERLVADLNYSGFEAAGELVKSATFEEVERIANIARNRKANFLIGLGGGKSIDVAKLASFNCRIPFASVPTSGSHDGISSPFASVKGLGRPYSLVAKPPIAIIADLDLVSSAPPHLLTSGCGDLLSKKTAVRDWALSHEKTGEYYGAYSASLALLSADLVMDNSALIAERKAESVRIVVEALISSGVAAGIAGSSRPCSGSEHLFSHAMDIVAPGRGMHGEKCGMGTIMMAELQGLDYEAIRRSLQKIGAPVRAKEIGASTEDIVRALVLARTIRKERYTILDEVKLDDSSARKLAAKVGVLDG